MKRLLIAVPIVLILLAGAAGGLWWFSSAGKVARLVEAMRDPQPAVGYQAWEDLRLLVRADWNAVKPTVAHVYDEDLISFHMTRSKIKQDGKVRYPFIATPRGIGMDGPIICKTVGDAILMMAYSEGLWRTDLRGNDLKGWWRENKAFYGQASAPAKKP